MYDISELKPDRKETAIAILVSVAVLVAIFCAGYLLGLRTNVPDHGDGAGNIGEQLGTAVSNQQQITDGVGSAKEGAAHIETGIQHVTESAEQSAAAVSEAAGLIDSSQQILGRIRNRGKK